MKFCKNCKYYSGPMELCTHPKSTFFINVVSGHVTHYVCAHMRGDYGQCNGAKLFEPSLLYRIINGFTKCFRKSKKSN